VCIEIGIHIVKCALRVATVDVFHETWEVVNVVVDDLFGPGHEDSRGGGIVGWLEALELPLGIVKLGGIGEALVVRRSKRGGRVRGWTFG
jgi:hypothetical protein